MLTLCQILCSLLMLQNTGRSRIVIKCGNTRRNFNGLRSFWNTWNNTIIAITWEVGRSILKYNNYHS